MKYKIHNEKSIEQKKLRKRTRKLIANQICRFDNLASNYKKELVANVYINRTDKNQFLVSVTVNLKSGELFLKERADVPEAAVYKVFDKLKNQLAKRIHKEQDVAMNMKRKTVLKFDEEIAA